MTPLPPKLHKRSNTICYDATGITPLRGARRSSTSVNSDPSKPYYQHLTNTGSEPGVDVKRDADSYTHLNKPTRVTVVDYTSDGDGYRVDIPGEAFDDWLNSEDGKRPQPDDIDEKTRGKSVRWINVDGINFDTLRTLGLYYNLHPLAIEDALRAINNPRSKVDFYANHLYSQVVVQHIRQRDKDLLDGMVEMPEGVRGVARHPGESARRLFQTTRDSAEMRLPEGVEGVFEPVTVSPVGDMPEYGPPTSAAHQMTIDQLSAKYMIPLRRTVLSIFMLRDGTLITICANPFKGLLMPIYKRLEDQQGILRRTADASMLLEGLFDIIVDIALEITKAFEQQILKMEAGCLVNAEMETVRHLHVISSQLIRLKRTWAPLQRVLYTLRDQDSQRAAASMAINTGTGGTTTPAEGSMTPAGGLNGNLLGHDFAGSTFGGGSFGTRHAVLPFNTLQSAGYISMTTKIYLSDVIDHLDSVVTSIDQYVNTCGHLTDYIFNMLSFVTNASMERLSLVTVIFLPLTFLAGYFGMNFTSFDAIQGSVAYFWKVAAPLTVAFFLVFCYSYIINGFRIIARKIGRKRREEMLQKAQRKAGGAVGTRSRVGGVQGRN